MVIVLPETLYQFCSQYFSFLGFRDVRSDIRVMLFNVFYPILKEQNKLYVFLCLCMYFFIYTIQLKWFLLFSFGHQLTQDKVSTHHIRANLLFGTHLFQTFRFVIHQGQGLASTTASQRSTTARTSPIWIPSYVPVMLVHWVSPLR